MQTTSEQRSFGRISLLSLIHDLDGGTRLSQRHTSCALFCTYCACLSLVLYESNVFPPWHRTHFPETLKSTKYCSKLIHADIFRYVLDEENLVGWEIFFRDNGAGCWIRGLETSTSGRFDWPYSSRIRPCSWSLKLSLQLCGFVGLFPLCRYVSKFPL